MMSKGMEPANPSNRASQYSPERCVKIRATPKDTKQTIPESQTHSVFTVGKQA